MKSIAHKCKAVGCEHYIVWTYWGSELCSCKLVGQSDDILEPADNCPHKDELNKI